MNIEKHGISFEVAKDVFDDPKHIILVDEQHSQNEERFYCVGLVDDMVLTVRFVFRDGKIRIFGAGHWRKEKKLYERKSKVRRSHRRSQ
ncbi:MAG: BrnT family toxin [Defluviitaleaceae bacterium]|nr:BrnT family toxin [Defluviitaleaceae bacterium]